MTALDIIKAALRRITSYQSGDQIADVDVNDALECLNDLLDSFSIQKAIVFCTTEIIVDFTPLQYQYTIGPGGNFAVDTSGNAIPRPIRITSGFTRISQLDFTIDVFATQEEYNARLLKTQPAPWPLIAWYNPTVPYGALSFYPNPSAAAELHLFIDSQLTELASLTTAVTLPPGYARMLKWNLAQEICAEYGYPLSEVIKKNAKDSLDAIKALNVIPAQLSSLDPVLLNMRNQTSASWIINGGFG